MQYATKLNDSFLEYYKGKVAPFGQLGQIVYKRNLSRLIPCLGRTEVWQETCERVCNGILEIGGLFTEGELEQLFDNMFKLKGLPASRVLWQAGTETTRKIGVDGLNSCWGVTVNSLEAFTFSFNQLLMDSGVGYNVQPVFVFELPRVKQDVVIRQVDSADCSFLVPDNREGWVELLYKVLESFFVTGRGFTFSTQCVRPAGRLLNTFGGRSSGAENLTNGISQIIRVIKARESKKLKPIDCMDVMNILGQINFHRNSRNAQLALGNIDDPLFMDAKDWSKGRVPNWRAMSNNSVAVNSYDKIPDEFWNRDDLCGLVNLKNGRRFGRLVDGENYRPDYKADVVNACSEIFMENGEPCNLCDIILPRIESLEELKQVATLLYKVCKTISCAKYFDPITQAVVDKNHRIGVSLTGLMQSNFFNNCTLESLYRHLEQVDEAYSRELGVSKSIKLTCIKPSGTISLLPGVTAGMHPAYANYMIQRIRFNADDSLVEVCQEHGYKIEPHLGFDGSEDSNIVVIEFPIKQPGITKDQVSVVQQLENQKLLQTYWADNGISATHYFKDAELPEIKEWLKNNYDDNVKSCIFLRTDNKVYPQAPYEAITEEEYNKRKRPPITSVHDTKQIDMIDSLECAGGCPIK